MVVFRSLLAMEVDPLGRWWPAASTATGTWPRDTAGYHVARAQQRWPADVRGSRQTAVMNSDMAATGGHSSTELVAATATSAATAAMVTQSVPLAALGGHRVVAELVATLDAEHPMSGEWPIRERITAAAWLAGYRSARTRRAYVGDLSAWLSWLAEREVDVLAARRVHVDLWTRELLGSGIAGSSVSRRLSALSSYYRHLAGHDLIAANPVTAVRRPRVDPDHTATVGLDRDQVRALLAAADADTGPAQLRTVAAIRLLVFLALRVDELAGADVTDLGHNRGHRVLTVTRKGGHRVEVVLPPTVVEAVDLYLADRMATAPTALTVTTVASENMATGVATEMAASYSVVGGAATVTGPLLATRTGGRLDQAALWHLVRRLARAAAIPQWARLSPHSLRHTAITLALDAGASLRDVQDYAGHRDPRTTRRYDRSRGNLDRNAAYTLATYLA